MPFLCYESLKEVIFIKVDRNRMGGRRIKGLKKHKEGGRHTQHHRPTGQMEDPAREGH